MSWDAEQVVEVMRRRGAVTAAARAAAAAPVGSTVTVTSDDSEPVAATALANAKFSVSTGAKVSGSGC